MYGHSFDSQSVVRGLFCYWTSVTVPAAATPGFQTYTIPTFFTVVDDNINEVRQSFAIVAEIGPDVPYNCYVEDLGLTDCSCFQIGDGEFECFG